MNDIAANLAMPARWLMVVGIAYTLATTVLYFVAPPPSTAPTAPAATRSAERPPTDVNAILASNLFGAADAVDGESAAPVETAVVTQLPLELLGVFVADVDGDSAAIISQRGRQGILYALGEELPGNATLVEVHPDHVVLRRAGVRETLHFPVSGQGLAAQAVYSEPIQESYDNDQYQYMEDVDQPDNHDEGSGYDESTATEPEDVGELISDYRERLDEDPSGALEELGVEAVSSGAAEGYRIGDLAQSPYLSQTGLQPGDVVLSINGRPVGDLNQDRQELDNVLAQGSARLEVQRGSRRFFVTASLP